MSVNQKLAKRVPLPSPSSINGGLHSPHNASVIRYLGLPSQPKTQRLLALVDVGPFELYCLKPFGDLLARMFAEVKTDRSDLYYGIKSAGCYNHRLARGSSNVISNHSWGIAWDSTFNQNVTPRGSKQTEQGLLDMYPYFHKYKLYWGAEFPTDDAMHVEASLELLLAWQKAKLI